MFATLIALSLLAAAPASESAVDAFIAALPPAAADADPGEGFDQDRLQRLVGLNPGREAEVRDAFAAGEQCEQASKDKAVADALRSSARSLGDDKLERLTAFYAGPDHALFSRLTRQEEDERSDLDKAELERILADYPLEDYFRSVRETEKEMWSQEGLLGALMKCDSAVDAELARRGLKS